MKRQVKGAVIALALMSTPIVLVAQLGGDTHPISLDEAVRLAQQNQPSTVQARNALRTGESSIRQQMLGYLPSLGINTSANQRGGVRYDTEGRRVAPSPTPWSYGRSLNIGNVTLFDGGQRWNNLKTQRSNLSASEATLVSQRYNVALSVKTAYYAVLTAREQESAAQRQLEQAEQQLRVSTAKINAGSATRTDSLSGAIAVGNARQAILNAQNQLRNANAQLTRYVATPYTVTAMAADTSDIGPIEVDEASLVSMALDGPGVRQSTAQVNAAQTAAKAARAPYLPTLSMSASYSLTVDNSEHWQWGASNGNSTGLGFSLSYTLFNNYNREAQIVSTRVGVENAEANLRDQKFAVQQNLTTYLNNFRTALLTIELNKLQIQAAEENLRVVQEQYNLGTKQLLDLLTAQTSLDNVRASLISSRQNARLAKANIESLIGRDLP